MSHPHPHPREFPFVRYKFKTCAAVDLGTIVGYGGGGMWGGTSKLGGDEREGGSPFFWPNGRGATFSAGEKENMAI
jgi:hypothetical protein